MDLKYSELIFTRCRQGIDLLNPGRRLTSDGFKVYACTPSLMDDGVADIPFIQSVVSAKQPFADPGLMDDAYLYLVPDHGDSFLVDFYPVPRDRTETGNFSHRPGNYLTDALFGDFSVFYPFELFHDPDVWTARSRGEAYYYETEPSPLPVRQDIGADPPSQIYTDDLAAFVADGRQEALKAAVSFLIAQYETPAENRKYLVIKDESTTRIELWIAAIEYAFSPRIAASIPFATRLDKFATSNLYTINQQGLYQAQTNRQDASYRSRFRAMVVGVDERDRTNATAVRPMPASAYVVLDGKARRALFEADTSDRYYMLITQFDDAHTDFVRNFLQMVDIRQPGRDIYRLLSAYITLNQSVSFGDVEMILGALDILRAHRVFVTQRLQKLCDQIANAVPSYLQQNVPAALRIMDWLFMIAGARGDTTLPQRLTEMVCDRFDRQLYEQDDPEQALVLWRIVKATGFAQSVASRVTDRNLMQRNLRQRPLPATMWIAFAQIYLDSAGVVGSARVDDVTDVTAQGLWACVETKDDASARAIVTALARVPGVKIDDVLLSIADKADTSRARYVVGLLLAQDKSILGPGTSLGPIVRKLQATGRNNIVGVFAQYWADTVSTSAEIEQCIRDARQALAGDEAALTIVFQTMDGKLSLLDKRSVAAAIAIQQGRPSTALCPVSAHIYALEVLGDKRLRRRLPEILAGLAAQGFPSIANLDYAKVLVDRLSGARLDDNEWGQIITWFSRSATYADALASLAVDTAMARQPDLWNILVDVAAKTPRNLTLRVAVVNACASLRQGEKALPQLGGLLQAKAARAYFAVIAQEATDQMQSNRPQGFLGRLRRQ